MKTTELFSIPDQQSVEIKIPSLEELLALEEVPEAVKKHKSAILQNAKQRFGGNTNLPPGVYHFNIKESPKHRIDWEPSPHFSNRSSGRIDMVIIHYTVTSNLKNTVAWFQNPIAKVSAHYVVGKDGTIVQMVKDEHKAWHAGDSYWKGEKWCNSFSVGIEVVNEGEKKGIPYTPLQYEALLYLCSTLKDRYLIDDRRILGHSDISPYRKIDPGTHFDWGILQSAGIGFLPQPLRNIKHYDGISLQPGDNDGKGIYAGQKSGVAQRVRELQTDLRNIGYFISVDGDYGPKTRSVVEAFQKHYAKRVVTGVTDADTACFIKGCLAA
ncbi:MAG: N-acetylmuramoyl-L-alanine amidase [Calditrichia bacterium]